MSELVISRANIAFAARLKPRTAGSSEDLKNVQDGEVYKCTLRAVIHLSAFDDHCWKFRKKGKMTGKVAFTGVGRQIDTPSKRCGTAKNLKATLSA